MRRLAGDVDSLERYLPGARLKADPKSYDEKCLELILKVCLKGISLPSEQDK